MGTKLWLFIYLLVCRSHGDTQQLTLWAYDLIVPVTHCLGRCYFYLSTAILTGLVSFQDDNGEVERVREKILCGMGKGNRFKGVDSKSFGR